MQTQETHAYTYPLATIATLAIALLVAVTSIAGLAANLYPTEEMRQAFLANDLVNLIVGLPILIGTLWSARRGHRVGLLFWPGALFFVLYNALVYLFAMPLDVWFVLYLLQVTLSVYTLAGVLASIDADAIMQHLRGLVAERWIGGALAALGGLFLLRSIGVIIDAGINQTALPVTDRGLLVADFVIGTAWLIGGVLLWRRMAAGYVVGPGLLFQGAMLFLGLILFLILQPIVSNVPFALADLIVIGVMSLVCFVPFALFVRGASGHRLPSRVA